MRYAILFFSLVLAGCAGEPALKSSFAQPAPEDKRDLKTYTRFGPPARVTIDNYSGDGMEPFISRDGRTLFFNSVNDGVDSSIYNAVKVTETRFNCLGKIKGAVNGTKPHLDVVPSMTAAGRFIFTSTRDYDKNFRATWSGDYLDGTVAAVSDLAGDFPRGKPGWVIMDCEISPDGRVLWFSDTRIEQGHAGPVYSVIGFAEKTNGAYHRPPDMDDVMREVNGWKSNILYAPSATGDGLELFFTRLNPYDNVTELYRAARKTTADAFSAPERIPVRGNVPEAITVTADGRRVYFHMKDQGVFRIFTMTRP